MNSSQLIRKICKLADEKFATDDDNSNDCVSVQIYPTTDPQRFNGWCACLVRPTKQERDSYEYTSEELLGEFRTINNYRIASHCYVEGDTLMNTLHNLYDLLNQIDVIPSGTDAPDKVYY
jgi:hypothetical protein